jgi:hypothetical protein
MFDSRRIFTSKLKMNKHPPIILYLVDLLLLGSIIDHILVVLQILDIR